MSGQPDTSDDLIAELAKLMATNAKPEPQQTAAARPQPTIRVPGLDMPLPAAAPAAAAPKPSAPVVPLTQPAAAATPAPAAPAPQQAPAPAVRIPGMPNPIPVAPNVVPSAKAPAAEAAPIGAAPTPAPVAAAQPAPTSTVRIPGMPAPAPALAVASKPAETKPAADARKPVLEMPFVPPRPTRPADAGAAQPKPATPAAGPVVPAAARPAEPRPVVAEARAVVAPTPVAPEPRAAAQSAVPPLPPAQERREPTFTPAAPPKPAEKAEPALAPQGQGFDFAFDLNSNADSKQQQPEPEDHDPIAEIIAAELAASAPPQPSPAPEPAPARVVPRPAAAGPAPAKFATLRPSGPMPHLQPGRPGPVNFASQGRLQPATPITLKPINSGTPGVRVVPAAESDAFAVAPLALGAKPVQPPPANNSTPVSAERPAPTRGDPMDEIESLIGEAVRVDLGPDGKTKPAPAQVAPMTTAFAPRRTDIAEPRPASIAPKSAEEAILAAAAATGANVGRVEPVETVDAPAFQKGRKVNVPRAPKPVRERRPGGARQYAGMAVAATLLLAAGFGLYWVLGLGNSGSATTAPVLTADAAPVKELPAIVESNVAQPRSVVLDELDGVTAGTETLVSTDETQTTDVAAVTSSTEFSETGLANRKVRTVTVRPDGTIVTGEDTVAGSEALPVARPNVPEVPGNGSLDASDLLTAAAQTVTSDPIAAVIANPDAAPVDPVAVAALTNPSTTTAGVTTPVDPNAAVALLDPNAAAVPLDPNMPVPMPRMLNRPTEPMVTAAVPTSAVNAVVTEPVPSLQTAVTADGPVDLLAAPVPQANVAAAQPAQTSTPAAAYIQLSSQRSEAEARSALRGIQERWGNMLPASPEIHRADLGARGIYYRVRVPMGSRNEAARMCQQIANAGGDCFVP